MFCSFPYEVYIMYYVFTFLLPSSLKDVTKYQRMTIRSLNVKKNIYLLVVSLDFLNYTIILDWQEITINSKFPKTDLMLLFSIDGSKL